MNIRGNKAREIKGCGMKASRIRECGIIAEYRGAVDVTQQR